MFLPERTHRQLFNIADEGAGSDLHIITIEGDHGAGKDVYASILQKIIEQHCYILRFADDIRADFEIAGYKDIDILKRYNLIFPDNTIIGGYNVQSMTTREAMIHIAETNKKAKPFMYADILCNEIHSLLFDTLKKGQTLTIIIPDLRFEVEKEALQNLMNVYASTQTKLYIGETDIKMPQYDYSLDYIKYIHD